MTSSWTRDVSVCVQVHVSHAASKGVWAPNAAVGEGTMRRAFLVCLILEVLMVWEDWRERGRVGGWDGGRESGRDWTDRGMRLLLCGDKAPPSLSGKKPPTLMFRATISNSCAAFLVEKA